MDRVLEFADRYWKWIVVAAWLGFCAYFLFERWTVIRFFWLPDTDDNLRIAQVRALLSGQDWFDLRQYRLNPPAGADIHWSRLVDLPLAGLILLFRPLVGGADAERIAIAVAPMLPMLLLFFSLALAVRRLVDRSAYPLAFAVFFFAGSIINMFMPARIDHHGWQLALLGLAIAGISDPKRARGGATLGIATALSLSIGLEMVIYLALAGGAMALFWVADAGERRRLAAYAAAVGGGTALGFLIFASYANRLPVCDALSPVWLSDALLGSALLFGLAMLSPASWKTRLALAVGAGLIVAAFHALAWPHCLSRLEGVSPEVEKLWLDNVREARPLYRHGWRIAMLVSGLAVTGIIGWGLLGWVRRRDRDQLRRILAAGIPCLVATLLLLWQTRTGPAAQVLAIPGAVALLWIAVPVAANSRHFLVTTVGTAILVVLGFGAGASLVDRLVPRQPKPKHFAVVDKAARQCTSLWGLKAVAQQPKGIVFTFVDLGPRLITVTPHSAIIGPYHRNDEQIGDVMKAFRGDERQARAIVAKYRADYVLICPNMATATIFMSEARKGFYGQLSAGRVPAWLEPVPLPKDSPFRMWRVKRQALLFRSGRPAAARSDDDALAVDPAAVGAERQHRLEFGAAVGRERRPAGVVEHQELAADAGDEDDDLAADLVAAHGQVEVAARDAERLKRLQLDDRAVFHVAGAAVEGLAGARPIIVAAPLGRVGHPADALGDGALDVGDLLEPGQGARGRDQLLQCRVARRVDARAEPAVGIARDVCWKSDRSEQVGRLRLKLGGDRNRAAFGKSRKGRRKAQGQGC